MSSPCKGCFWGDSSTQQAHQRKGTSLGHWLAELCFNFFFRVGIEFIQSVMEGKGGKGEGEEERRAQMEGKR